MKANVVSSSIWAPSATSAAPPSSPAVGTLGVTTGDLTGAADVIMSDPLPVDLFVYRGDTGRFRVAVTNGSTGTPLDISSATWDCDVRTSFDASSVICSLAVNPVDVNTVEVVLEPLASALLVDNAVWDLQMSLGVEVQTLMSGVVHVHKDVSRV